MKVEQILGSKGADVVAVSASALISEAVNVLGERNIGAVIVTDGGGRVSGILSERDIVRRLRRDGPATLDARVAECMTPNPYTCAPETEVDEVMTHMTDKRIRHMPVMQEDRLVGVVSIGDVVKRKIEQIEREAEALKEYISS